MVDGRKKSAPGLDRIRSPAADRDIEVQPVLERLLLRHHLKPDPRARSLAGKTGSWWLISGNADSEKVVPLFLSLIRSLPR